MKIKNIKNLIRALYPYYKPPYIKNKKRKIYLKNFSKISKNEKKKYIYIFKCKDGEIGLMKKDIIV